MLSEEDVSVKTKHDRIALARQFMEHAPPPGPVADGLLGWQCRDMAMCASCVGRVMARGCHMDDIMPGMWAVWSDSEVKKRPKGCDTCGKAPL